MSIDHHGVVADDDAGVGVALGRVGVRVLGQLVEADPLLLEIGLRSEVLFHDGRRQDVAQATDGPSFSFATATVVTSGSATPFFTAVISARIEIAISGGVRLPM